MKLRKLTITGFRGARFPLTIDFSSSHRSLSVFGENASGKSTITDALEWFITGKVGHLWREDCKEGSLRNVLIDDGDLSEVAIEFSDGTSNIKRLDAKLSTKHTNLSLDFHKLIAALSGDRVFLRYAQIAQFIQQSKSEKRKAIASIIGYDDITNFRNIIQTTQNSLQRDPKYATAKHRVEGEKKNLLRLAGRLLTTPQMLYDQMNLEISRVGFDLTVHDKESYLAVAHELRTKINQEERVEKKLLLDSLIKEIGSLRKKLANLNEMVESIEDYNTLIAGRDVVGQLHLVRFLDSGARIIDDGHVTDEACPFCLGEYNLEQLRSEVDQRLQAMEALNEKLQAVTPAVDATISALLDVKASCDNLATKYNKLDTSRALAAAARQLVTAISSLHADLVTRLKNYQSITLPAPTISEIAGLDALAVECSAKATLESASLNFSEYESKIIGLLERLRDLRETFFHFVKSSTTVSAFETQIRSLNTIFQRFVLVQNTALQTVLDAISDDVAKFYRALHPDEPVDNVKLRMVGEEGIEFEYYFHGKPTHPPMKYLSESHLNSLGIVLFLASARLFNAESKFIVLDDIVTSFDVNHRRRLLRLIRDEFADWQVLLLTHEGFLFDMIKRELLPQGWLALEVTCDDENGIQIEPSAKDLRALIMTKRKKYDVSNDLRKLLEATLKEICFNYGVKVGFRYNDQNERRMTGELLSELRTTVNQKCSELKGNPIFAQLEGSNLVATVGSHDNSESITGGDIDVALADIETLDKLFSCAKCGRYVEAKNILAGKHRITCRCGSKELDCK